jgi:hypothetical protein
MSDPLRVFARPSALASVVRALSVAAISSPLVYVERRGDRYTWSPAHRGGPYPLLRVVAKVLGVDHHGIVLPFRWRGNVCVVAIPEKSSPNRGRSWTSRRLEPSPSDSGWSGRCESADRIADSRALAAADDVRACLVRRSRIS